MKYLVISFLLAGALCHAADRYTVVYQFEKDANSNNSLESIRPLILGNTLYAATRNGGLNSKGTLCRLNVEGTNCKLLYEFTGGDESGHSPCGGLVPDGNALYGLTTHGGRGKGGTVYCLNTDGSGYKTLHNFEGWYYDGDNPYGSLVLDAGKLYGLTARGGTNEAGVIFCLNKDGSDFRVLHSFLGGRNDGATPYGSLTAGSDAFYGMTFAGGNRNKGVIFRLNKDGSGYKILHHFTGSFDNGSNPVGSLLLDGDTLYGMTFDGGSADKGTVFSIRKDGCNFMILHSFDSDGNKGIHPQGALVLVGDTLYGLTRTGGRNEAGTLFCVTTDGKQFRVLHRFDSGVTGDGIEPYGELAVHDGALYGITRRGGSGGGVLFRYQVSTP